jgi:hypothetical protein
LKLKSPTPRFKGRTLVNPKWERNETEVTISRALEKVAGEVGRGVSSNAGT